MSRRTNRCVGSSGCGYHYQLLGDLCGQCVNGTGVSLDLQSCSSVPCFAGLISFLLLSCKWV